MAFGDGAFRTRAASLLRSSTPSTNQTQGANHEKPPGSPLRTPPGSSLNEKAPTEADQNNLEDLGSLYTGGRPYHPSGPDAVAHNTEARRLVREIPRELSLAFALVLRSSPAKQDLCLLTSSLASSLGTYSRRSRGESNYRISPVSDHFAGGAGRSTQQ